MTDKLEPFVRKACERAAKRGSKVPILSDQKIEEVVVYLAAVNNFDFEKTRLIYKRLKSFYAEVKQLQQNAGNKARKRDN